MCGIMCDDVVARGAWGLGVVYEESARYCDVVSVNIYNRIGHCAAGCWDTSNALKNDPGAPKWKDRFLMRWP